MKKLPIGCVAWLGLVATAQAQSVTLYGIVDTGIEYLTHANGNGNDLFRMPATTGSFPSRWGLAGQESLGEGYTAVFRLESGFNVRDGSLGQGGRLFGRQAYVGISSKYGTVTLGRQNSMTYWTFYDFDILGASIYGLGSLDQYMGGARIDNSIAYRGKFGSVSVGATYSFGRDSVAAPAAGGCAGNVAGEYSQCKEWSAMLQYDSGSFGVAGSFERQNGGTASTVSFYDALPLTHVGNSGSSDSRYLISGYVKVKNVRFIAGWLGRDVDPNVPGISSIRSNVFYTEASLSVRPDIVFDLAAYKIIVSGQDARAMMGVARGTYILSKSTSLYSMLGYLANSPHARFSVSGAVGVTNPAPGASQLGTMIGMTHRF